ncbi:ParB/RepB/Spo0J family partition protein (plasmid) [Xanthomonas sp. NCPPB 3583]|uniref:ParB/RepB/Spo0J family partition protein n=1 Tax=Xanthomonas sp. NCPPB 3583 TaxID=487558 RepID=UPI003558CC74
MKKLGSKADRFAQPTKATANIAAMVEGHTAPKDAGTFIEIPIAQIIPDPKNHRDIKLDWDNPEQIAEDDPYSGKKYAELELLREMAKSIANPQVGLINAITVLRRGDSYQLISGHRRTLAHKLAGRTIIRANVRSRILTRLAQHVENAQRRDIDLAELITSLRAVMDEVGIPVASGIDHSRVQEALQEEVGYARIQGYRLAVILVASDSLHEAINSGLVTSMMDAFDLAKLSVDELALELASRVADHQSSSASSGVDADQPKDSRDERTGKAQRRSKDFVTLGKVRNTNVIKLVMTKVLGDDVPPDINWNDLKAVEKAFKKMINKLAETTQ